MLILQTPASIIAKKNRYTVAVARNPREIEEAQRLRYQVFMEELGARAGIAGSRELDIDEYDADCDHLIVRDQESLHVVGCYRIMRPEVAARRGAFYSDSEFDLGRLHHLRSRTAEVGRACIHPDFRSGSVIMLLWSGLARLVVESGYGYAIGCASINLSDGHANAVAVFRDTAAKCLAPGEYRVFPRHAYPMRELRPVESLLVPKIPPLLKGYVRLGAWVGGDPAWDPDFNTADLFVLLPVSRISGTYARHFFGQEQAA
jgi:putative hemolysin